MRFPHAAGGIGTSIRVPGPRGVCLGRLASPIPRFARHARHLRQSDLAAKVGNDPSAISRLFRLDHALAAPAQPTNAARDLGAAARYRHARKLFDAGQLARLIDVMPSLLATAHADTATHHPVAYAQLTACYTLASETLNKAGAHEASRLTADRAVIFADLAESPLSPTVAARALGIVLRHQGDHGLADEVALTAASALEAPAR